MRITEVQVKLDDYHDTNERIRAYCSITLDGMLVIRDLKVIEGAKGLFVAFPSRKLLDRCKCGTKNHLRAIFCNYCGRRLNESRAPRDAEGRLKLHADIAHPITSECRSEVEAAVLAAYMLKLTETELAEGREKVPA